MFRYDLEMAEARSGDKYYRHPPSEQANGCFVAVVTREVRLSDILGFRCECLYSRIANA